MKNSRIILFFIILTSAMLGQDFDVGEQTIYYKDRERLRPVKTEIWYPTQDKDSLHERITELPFRLPPTIRNAKFVDQHFPLIVMSHGTGGNRFSLAWLAIGLAKKGYIVVAPDHWGNTYDNKIPEYFVRYWERPMDIRFLLDALLKDRFYNRYIDTNKIGMLGFSYGGYTALAVAGVEVDCNLLKEKADTDEGEKEFTVPELGDLTEYIEDLSCEDIPKSFRDDRFKAFVALAPALGLGLSGQVQNADSAVLIIGCENDAVAPVVTNALQYHRLIPGSEYIELKGKTGHYVFLNEGDDELQTYVKEFYADDNSVDRKSIHEQVTDIILTFLRQNLK